MQILFVSFIIYFTYSACWHSFALWTSFCRSNTCVFVCTVAITEWSKRTQKSSFALIRTSFSATIDMRFIIYSFFLLSCSLSMFLLLHLYLNDSIKPNMHIYNILFAFSLTHKEKNLSSITQLLQIKDKSSYIILYFFLFLFFY